MERNGSITSIVEPLSNFNLAISLKTLNNARKESGKDGGPKFSGTKQAQVLM